jgi:hypothetical protein
MKSHRNLRAAYTVIFSALLILGLIGTGGPAAAAPPPVLAGLTITPATTAVGTGAQVVATATNTTPGPLDVSTGVDVPPGIRVSTVAGTAGCHPRNLTRLVYCGVQRLAPHATATITFTATPTASGTFSFRSYARITYSSDNSFAYATLIAS